MGTVDRLLRQAGASKEFRDAYRAEAMSSDYDHLLAASVAYLEAEDKWDNLEPEVTTR